MPVLILFVSQFADDCKVCLATGARWSEAENLQGHQPRHRIYTNEGQENRTVPISQDLV